MNSHFDGGLAEVVPYLHAKAPVRLLRGYNQNACAMPVSGDVLAQLTRGTEKTEARRAKARDAAQRPAPLKAHPQLWADHDLMGAQA